MIRSRVIGTGHAMPDKVLTNMDLEAMMDTSDEWIRQRTGIHQRHVVSNGQASSDLGVLASERAIAAAGLTPADIDLIVCCTTTPDYFFPSTGCMIQRKLDGCRAPAFDVNAACSGFVYGLSTADAFIRAGNYRTVLVVGTEVISGLVNWRRRETAVLFGDGAGALVLQAGEPDRGVLTTFLAADGADCDILIMPKGGSKHPTIFAGPADAEEVVIEMRGQELFKRAVHMFGEAIQRAYDDTGLSPDALDLFVPHQANDRILKAAADRAGLPLDKVYINVDKRANTVAASIPIALDEAVQEGRIHEGAHVMLASFGAGLTWGSAMIRW